MLKLAANHLPLFLSLWAVAGLLSWSLANYSIEEREPEGNTGLLKWAALTLCFIAGPISFVGTLCLWMLYGKIYLGLRFK